MTNSRFCVRQRQQEQQRLNKLLILGFAGSTVLHGILAYTLPRWSFESPKTAEEPMELILVDKPKPQPKPKPKIESKPIVEPKPKTVKPPEPVQPQTPPPSRTTRASPGTNTTAKTCTKTTRTRTCTQKSFNYSCPRT